MPVSSVNVLVQGGKLPEVRDQILETFGAEVHHPGGDYLVVVLVGDSAETIKDHFQLILALEGVLSANVVYYNEEDLETSEEPL